MSKAPQLKDVQGLITSTLVASSYFIAASTNVAFNNDGTDYKSVVLQDRGTARDNIERHLRDSGLCCVVLPLIEAACRDQSGTETLNDAQWTVQVRLNPVRNRDQRKGAQVDMYEAVQAVIDTLTRAQRHPGGEFFKLQKEQAVVLNKFDDGLWVYDINVTKDVRSM